MLEAAKEFRIGRPQILAGLMLLAFVAQCLWAANSRKLSDLEKVYIASGLGSLPPESGTASPLTAWTAALPVRGIQSLRRVSPAKLSLALAIPRPLLIRLPFIVFGLWLGGALWWVSRRLFGDEGGY